MMRVLVTGANGLIGSAVASHLRRDGHDIVATARDSRLAARRGAAFRWLQADFSKLITAAAWMPLLAGIDAVVNCVGVLQDGAGDDVLRVQVDACIALFEACAAAKLQRLVHISAIGAAADAPTEFARSKAQADAHLQSLDIDWAILRPGLVLAPAVYGGSALLFGVAGCPGAIPLAGGDPRIQIVSVDDLTGTVARCLAPDAPARMVWDIAHPTVLTLGDIVVALRAWLGFSPAPAVAMPRPAVRVVTMVADMLGWLGWRSPLRSTALAQLDAGVVGAPQAWMAATGNAPKSLGDILLARPASVQDRWFARLYFVKPMAIAAIAVFWIATGVIAVGPGAAPAVDLLAATGVAPGAAAVVVGLGAFVDIVLGAALLYRPWASAALKAMLVVSVAYLAAGSWLMPTLWLDPLGPLTKIIPEAIAILATLAILDER